MTKQFGVWVISVHPGHFGLLKWWSWLHEHHNHWWRVLGLQVWPANQIALPLSLKWKSNKSTKHYLTEILVAINWCYWQAGKNSHMHMKIQDRLIQARFIEIHQVFGKKKVGYFSNRGIYNSNVHLQLSLQ